LKNLAMFNIARFIVFVCFFGSIILAWPLFGQSVKDAVQDEKIQTLEQRVSDHGIAIESLNVKQNYILGGVAGMYALMGIIGVFNAKLIRR